MSDASIADKLKLWKVRAEGLDRKRADIKGPVTVDQYAAQLTLLRDKEKEQDAAAAAAQKATEVRDSELKKMEKLDSRMLKLIRATFEGQELEQFGIVVKPRKPRKPKGP